MKKLWLSLAVLALAALLAVYLQAQKKEAKTPTKWDYLVLAIYKPKFESIFLDSSKAILYHQARPGGGQAEMEAIGTEITLREQGEEGWELVAVIGQLNGDKELWFKRPAK
jgi:hypothetical protein